MDELFMAAEYIMAEGNSEVILCERGIRTFTRHSRNTLDLNAIPYIKQESHLPVVVDPSHAAGRRHQVIPLARAAAAVGVDGLIVEVHNRPEAAMSDGPQSLYPEQFAELVSDLKGMNIAL
jgi:3-deoxy-7-phosphoheptulonate synthase